MQVTAVILVQLNCDLVEEALNIFNVSIVFRFCVDLIAPNDHLEFIDLKTENLGDLAPDVPQSLEVRDLDLLLNLVLHVKTVCDCDGLRLHVVEALSDCCLRQNGTNTFVAV